MAPTANATVTLARSPRGRRWRRPTGPGPLAPLSFTTPRSQLELVAQASNGQHVRGIGGVVLHLQAQTPDVDVDQAAVAEVSVAPHLVEQRLPAEHPPRGIGQLAQQPELGAREVDLQAVL